MPAMRIVWLVYLLGAVLALWKTDGSPATKLACAMLWPIGALAGVVTIAGMILLSLVAFPIAGAVAAGAAVLIWVMTAVWN